MRNPQQHTAPLDHEGRKELKAKARQTLSSHYPLLVALLVVASLLGTSYSMSLGFFKVPNPFAAAQAIDSTMSLGLGAGSTAVYDAIIQGNVDQGRQIAQDTAASTMGYSQDINGLQIAFSRGVLASFATSLVSGDFLIRGFLAIQGLIHSPDIATMAFILLSFSLLSLVIAATVDVYRVIYIRAFLEARTYQNIPTDRFLFLIRTRRWLHTAFTLAVAHGLELLWMLTIVGGPIKHYAYCLVPYVLAENPNIGTRQAIHLSQVLMRGHKWERFMLDLSFLGWDVLSGLTSGLIGMAYAYPYRECTNAEFYAHIRLMAKRAALQPSDDEVAGDDAKAGTAVTRGNARDKAAGTAVTQVGLLNDPFLFNHPHPSVLEQAYRTVAETSKDLTVPHVKQPSALRQFLADVFGVVLAYDPTEDAYRNALAKQHYAQAFDLAMSGRSYPERLSPLVHNEPRLQTSHRTPLRHYSLTSLVAIFLTLSVLGWLFEVGMHLLTDGNLVNRGVLHGPWLPIYGSGALIFITLLNKARPNPVLFFVLAIICAGVLEFGTSWALEALTGQRWWDYTGYLFNIQGRICAEGLLAFGVGASLVVYIIAPILDDRLSRLPKRLVGTVCIILLCIFAADAAYSALVPNTGSGVTDIGNDISLIEAS